MTLSLEKIEALAPDQGAVEEARKLLEPAAGPAVSLAVLYAGGVASVGRTGGTPVVASAGEWPPAAE
jgi:hypothetical protein